MSAEHFREAIAKEIESNLQLIDAKECAEIVRRFPLPATERKIAPVQGFSAGGSMTEEQKQAMIEFLKDNLSLESKTSENYVGGFNENDAMYEKCHAVNLVLCGEVISSVDL